jgi:hypothetical protein
MSWASKDAVKGEPLTRETASKNGNVDSLLTSLLQLLGLQHHRSLQRSTSLTTRCDAGVRCEAAAADGGARWQ